jgi:hypothetical protein
VFGAIAVSLTFGAAQFASGRDLPADPQDRLQSAFQDASQESMNNAAINRAAKADRAAGVVGAAAQTKTIALQPEGVSDTSLLIRIPVAQAPNGSSATKPGDWKTVACEPVVSVLTEVVKLLQPGRCVT